MKFSISTSLPSDSSQVGSWIHWSLAFPLVARISVFHKTQPPMPRPATRAIRPFDQWHLWHLYSLVVTMQPHVVELRRVPTTHIRCRKWKERQQCSWPVPWRCCFFSKSGGTKNSQQIHRSLKVENPPHDDRNLLCHGSYHYDFALYGSLKKISLLFFWSCVSSPSYSRHFQVSNCFNCFIIISFGWYWYIKRKKYSYF